MYMVGLFVLAVSLVSVVDEYHGSLAAKTNYLSLHASLVTAVAWSRVRLTLLVVLLTEKKGLP